MNTKTTILFDQNVHGHQITVEQSDKRTTLHFNNGLIQSQIDRHNAQHLPLLGNQMMLSHLLFRPFPQKILLAGCGGGAIARWFNAILPHCQGIAVENNETIINLAKQYFDFPSSQSAWSIHHEDIRTFIQKTQSQFDFILFDLEIDKKTPKWMLETEFLQQCKQRLSNEGAITFNIVAQKTEDFMNALIPIRQVFKNTSYCLANPESQNIMITALTQKSKIDNIQKQIDQVKKIYPLDFDAFYQQMQQQNPPNSGIF